MSKQNFSRINVDMNSLNVSSPGRSGFNLSKSSMQSIPFGKLYPVRCTKLMPNSTVKGSVNPDLQLEKFATPAAGRMRLDTHTFMVAAKRIHNGFKQFIESGITGRTAQNLPSFKMSNIMKEYFQSFIVPLTWSITTDDFADALGSFSGSGLSNPSWNYYRWLQQLFVTILPHYENPSNLDAYNKNIADFFSIEKNRLFEKVKVLGQDIATKFNPDITTPGHEDYLLGDFLYDVFMTLFCEGSTLDQLGYPIFSYYGEMRERLNDLDYQLRNKALGTATVWTDTLRDDYIAMYDSLHLDNILNSRFDLVQNKRVDFNDWDVSLSEMPIRANYAVWFDYFRDWHLDPETSCPNPDDFSQYSFFTTGPLPHGSRVLVLLAPRSRNWSRDGFTMVQPDDVYRHIYAPATAVSSAADYVDYQGDGFDAKFGDIEIGPGLPFPSSFTTLFGSVSNNETFYHDLQTMRRAEMLKRKLTRDYYNPDTYVGQHMARWGVEPVDFEIQCVQYLGGNESMISGDQVTSPVETDATTLGQRTLVANAASNDSFVYNMSEWAYLISYVSIVPLVHYDALNPTLRELSVHDQPIPEYANDNQVVIRSCDMLRDYFASGQTTMLGYVPRYYGYRMALDDVHGKYLREYRSYTWLRDRKSAGDSMLTKNAINAHVNVALDCFIGLREWDTVAFGNIQLPLFVECALPDKLENV